MLDTNVFDKIPDFIDGIKKSINQGYKYYITVVQAEELSKIPESKNRKKLKIKEILFDLKVEVLPSSSVFHGEGNRRVTSLDDIIIADTSVYEGCTLVTEDRELYEYMEDQDFDVMSFREFLSEIDV